MAHLVDLTGLSVRYLYRLRKRGVFEATISRNARVVFYNLKECERLIKRYMLTGEY
jgi:hypothetical protein